MCVRYRSWKDGTVLADLVDSVRPGLYPADSRPDDALAKINEAMQKAEEALKIPRVLKAEDMLDGADDLSVMTYVALYQEAVRCRLLVDGAMRVLCMSLSTLLLPFYLSFSLSFSLLRFIFSFHRSVVILFCSLFPNRYDPLSFSCLYLFPFRVLVLPLLSRSTSPAPSLCLSLSFSLCQSLRRSLGLFSFSFDPPRLLCLYANLSGNAKAT